MRWYRYVMRRIGLLFVALILFVGSAPLASADHGSNTHWAVRDVDVVTHFDDPQWHQVLGDAIAGWNAVGANVRFHLVYGAESEDRCGHFDNGTVNVCVIDLPKGYAGLTGWQTEGDGHLGAAYINFDNRGWPISDQRYLACHELGHALGLYHSSDANSCLTTSSWRPTRPDTHDTDTIRAMYAHSDRTAQARVDDAGPGQPARCAIEIGADICVNPFG